MSIESMLPVSLETAVTIMAGAAAFGTVCVVWAALLVPDLMGARAKRLSQTRHELRCDLMSPRRQAQHKVSAVGFMRRVTQRFDLLRSQTGTRTVEKLARAGWRQKDALVIFLFMKLVLPFVFGVASFIIFNLMGVGELSDPLPIVIPLAAVGIGAYAPEIFVRNATTRRQKLLQRGIPDAIDLLVICAEAGLSLDAAMNRVAREMQRASPEVAEEIGLTAIELGFLPERRQALDNLIKRCPMPAIRGVVNTLMQTEKYGTPLANALRVLAAEYRDERMLKAEDKAARLPAILTVPMIIFILPALLIVLVGPAGIRVLDQLSAL